MSRVEPFQTAAAARTRTPARSREARSGSAGFSLSEMPDHAAPRRAGQPAEASQVRNERLSARAVPERSRDVPRERTDEDRSGPARARHPDRADDAGQRHEAKRARDDNSESAGRDERPAAADPGQPGGKPDRPAGTENSDRGSEAARDGIVETAAEDGAAGSAAAQPGVPMAGMVGLGLAAGLDTAARQAQASAGGTSLDPEAAKVSRIGGSASPAGQGSGRAGDPDSGDGEVTGGSPAGKAEENPIPGLVSGVAGKHAENRGDKGGSGDSGLSELLGQAPGTPPAGIGPHARPLLADLLGHAAGPETRPAATAQRAILTDVSVGRLPIEIGLKSLEGSNQFEIRLSPDELGRVDVRLDIDDAGGVKAHLVVERPEALALLTRDRTQLERAFEQAGLKPAEGGIAFSLRDGSADTGGRGTQGGNDRPHGPGGARPGLDDVASTIRPAALPRAILSRLGALDLRI